MKDCLQRQLNKDSGEDGKKGRQATSVSSYLIFCLFYAKNIFDFVVQEKVN